MKTNQKTIETDPQTRKIALLNDRLRQTFWGGKIMITAGVNTLGQDTQMRIFAAVRNFNRFTEENDPYGEHDFGKVVIDGEDFFWKIDYYDAYMQYGSEDPANPEITTRVLTIMFADEY